MGELVTKGHFLQSLTIEEKVLMNALQQKKINATSPEKIQTAAKQIIAAAISRSGQVNVEPSVFAVMEIDLLEKMNSEFRTMTIEEIQIAVKEGGLKTESFGVSSRSVISWIREFRTNKKLELQKQIKLKLEKAKEQEKVVPELSEAEKIAAIQKQFENYLAENEVYTFIFPFLEEFGFIKTKEEKLKIWASACSQQHQKIAAQEVSAMARHFKKQRLELCQKAKLLQVKPEFIINEAQRITILQFFEFCIEKEMQPADYFDNYC